MGTIASTEHKARKTHHDDAADYFDFVTTLDRTRGKIVDPKEIEEYEFTPEEVATIQASIDNKWQIQPGQMYKRFFNSEDGEIWTFKTLSAIHDICVKYNLYQND